MARKPKRTRQEIMAKRQVDEEGNLQVMSDRKLYVEENWETFNGVKVNLAKYPGIIEGSNPLVGKNWKSTELDPLVRMVTLLLTKEGKGPSRRAVARYLNEHPTEGKKAVSEDMVRASTKRLVFSGQLVVVKHPSPPT
jgi:hypothetical protein